MRFDCRFVAPLAIIFATACSGAAPAPTHPKPTEAVQPIASSDVAVAGDEASYDVNPVEAPGEVVMHIRWANPSASASTLANYTGIAPSQANELLASGVKTLLREEMGSKVDVAAFANMVRTDAPIDVVIVADMSGGGQVPDPMLVVSVGLASVQGALNASKGAPRNIGNGVWEIGTQDKWGQPCVVAAAAGKAPARLVCGERKKHVEKVAAFVARNVATLPDSPHDIRVSVTMRGLLDKYGRQWANQAKGLPVLVEEGKIDNPKFDQALMDAADAVAAEAGDLIHDADSFVFDLGLDPSKGAVMGLEMRFADQRSWLVQTMVQGAATVGPAPDIAWQAPASADWVSWGHGGDPKRFDAMLAAGRAMLEGWMEHEKVGAAADRAAIAALLRTVQTGKAVPMVVAGGHFPTTTAPASVTELVDDTLGWTLMGFDESPASMKKWVEDAVKVYNRKTLQTLMKDEMGPNDAKHLPVAKVVANPAGFGAGALAVEITVAAVDDELDQSPNGPRKVDIKAHILLLGDGTRTWVAFGGKKTELAKMLVGRKAGVDALSGRTDLGRMKTERHAGGGFTSIDGIVGIAKPMAYFLMSKSGGNSGGFQDIMKVLASMPHKGLTPIYSFVDITAGAKPTVRWAAEVPRPALEDIGYLVEQVLR